MNITYRTRITLIRFAKIFPFILCAVVCLSYIESLYALITESYCTIDDGLTLNKPISWFIGEHFVYTWYTIVLAVVLSFAMETCIYNKLSIVYLCINSWERDYFMTIELYEEYIYAIVIANLIVSGFFVYKGISILFTKT